MFKKNYLIGSMQSALTFIIIIPMIFGSWGTTIYFLNKSGVNCVSFLANLISPNDLIIKVCEYGMVFYFIEILDPKFSFFSILTKFQQRMFWRIHWILTSPKGPTKIPVIKCLNLEVYSALIEYENEKAKPVDYLI